MIITTGQDGQQEQSVSDQDIPEPESQQVLLGNSTMSLTYSDFINPIEQLESLSSGSNEVGHDSPGSSTNMRHNLPNEFQVIDLDAPVPILQNVEEINEDFILLCEFSELEGPIPLITIPTDALEKTDINLNSLAIHVMFTDYQVNTVGQFKVCQDTQVMRTNVFKNVHIFMQYFTLYDIKARGFVRPFCFGFVTKDHVKLETNLEVLIHYFNNITTILKYSNRDWFKVELGNYLNKLSNAKENYPFIRSYTPPTPSSANHDFDDHFHHGTESYHSDTIDVDSCGDTISLQQIEHQFQEIRNIFQVIENLEVNHAIVAKLNELKEKCTGNPTCALTRTISELNFSGHLYAALNLPFAHPLKRKGEPLRPLTVLGQHGTLLFVWSLLETHEEFKTDLIFNEMTKLTEEFRKHAVCVSVNDENVNIASDSSDPEIDEEAIDVVASVIERIEATERLELEPPRGIGISFKMDPNCAIKMEMLNNIEICQVLEKLHLSCPIISSTDELSDSFITLSECSGTTTPVWNPSNGGNGSSSYQTAFGSLTSQLTVKEESSGTSSSFTQQKDDTEVEAHENLPSTSTKSALLNETEQHEDLSNLESKAVETSQGCRGSHDHFVKVPKCPSSTNSTSTRGSVNQYGGGASEEESNLIKTLKNSITILPAVEDSIIEIEKKPWWIYASKTKLQKDDPGYGLLKFFRHFHSTAHHVLYSILIGRPVIIFGKETARLKISQIFNCLLPLIPSYPSKSYKLLQWHQGILVGTHFKNFKLIGLCLPERLTIHDLIHQNDLNCVTILDYESRKISGPAYSGSFFENFSNTTFCQTKFFDDLSLLSYIGSILSEIESQVYMFKTMLMETEENDSNYDSFKSIPKIMKQLSLKSSDSEIVKYLSHILIDPSDCTEIF